MEVTPCACGAIPVFLPAGPDNVYLRCPACGCHSGTVGTPETVAKLWADLRLFRPSL